MISDEQIRNLLSEQENLRVALEVVRELEPLKTQLHKVFWSELCALIKEKLNDPDRSYESNWKLNLNPEATPEKWAYFDILPNTDYLEDTSKIMFVRLEQMNQSGDYAFRYGVMSPTLSDDEENLASVREVRKQITTMGFKSDGRSPWWLGISNLGPSARSDKFLLSMAGDHQLFVSEFAGIIWSLFVDIEATLREVNRDLNQD